MLPSLPTYSGRYPVGTLDLEVPVSQFGDPVGPPKGCDIPTIKARFFYPCRYPEKKSKSVYWVPNPQWEHLQAFGAFLGASNRLSKAIAYSSYFVRSAKIPAYRNAPLLSPPTAVKKWPIMVFSHGLGSGRNTYSQFCGMIASHGVVVVAPEHRDGSGPVSYVRSKDGKQSTIPLRSVPYKPSPESYDARDGQLRIRLWELGAFHTLLKAIEDGVAEQIDNLSDEGDKAEVGSVIKSLKARMNTAWITWAGHSFGAATIVQFVKSVYYGAPEKAVREGFKPLYNPPRNSDIVNTAWTHAPVVLLDLWGFPLLAPSSSWLQKQPLPCYTVSQRSTTNIVAILSESFFKWNQNLLTTKQAISPPPTAPSNTPLPHLFYAEQSAHLSQSDFGVLFPLVTRLVMKAQDPERILRLNTRAAIEMMRRAGVPVARTSDVDMEIPGAKADQRKNATNPDTESHTSSPLEAIVSEGKNGWSLFRQFGGTRDWDSADSKAFWDKDILDKHNKVSGWIPLKLDSKAMKGEGVDKGTDQSAKPTDVNMEV